MHKRCIVAGASIGGCTVMSRLVEVGNKVLVLERRIEDAAKVG